MNSSLKPNPLVDKSFRFALDVIAFSDGLELKRKFVMSRQLYKSGTSIGANIRESQGAESKADFVHKLKIALKEAEETEYWLQLCNNSQNYPNADFLLNDLKEIQKLLNTIIATTKRNMKN